MEREAQKENVVRACGEALIELIFPRVCTTCGKALDEEEAGTTCAACWSDVSVLEPPFCPTCGQPIRRFSRNYARCIACPQGAVYFDQAYSAVAYQGTVRDAVLDFKFGPCHRGNAAVLAPPLLSLWDRLMRHRRFDMIVSVPLHPARLREREFNQSQLLAEALQAHNGLPYLADALRRVRNTRPQSTLEGIDRLTNIQDAFAVEQPEAVSGQRVIVVDDVYTSGNTVNECSRMLKHAGAKWVEVATVARRV